MLLTQVNYVCQRYAHLVLNPVLERLQNVTFWQGKYNWFLGLMVLTSRSNLIPDLQQSWLTHPAVPTT